MKRNKLIWSSGLVALIYWIVFYSTSFSDGYLAMPAVALVVKLLLPVALIVNVGALALAFARFGGVPRRRSAAALTLHAVPLLAGMAFLWWLFWGVRI